jgi:hypothetical protein
MVLFSGMLPSSAGFMIGKWRPWPLFTRSCTLIRCVGKGRIGRGGSLLVKGSSRLVLFTGSLLPKTPFLFLGKVFGALRLLREWLFLLGRPHLKRLLTLDNVRKRGIVVINRCCMCESDGESIDHLFLHCGVARTLWNAIFSRFGLCWVMPSSVQGVVCYLVGGWQIPKCRCVEDGSSLPHVVHLE